MKIFGQLERAQFEGLTADPTGADLVVARGWYRTDTKRFKVYDGTAIQEFVDLLSAQTLQSKILSSPTLNTPTVSGATTYDELGSTPSTPAAGNHKIYYKNDGKLYTLDSAGNEVEVGSGAGGGGAKNYFEDLDAIIEDTIGGWLTDDGAGSPTASIAALVTTTAGEVLEGTASMALNKGSGNFDGYFFKSASKTIDPADRGRPLFGSFEMTPTSFGSGYTTGQYIFEVYDVTNAAVLYSGLASDLELPATKGRFQWVTYTEATTEQVQFRIKVNTTTTNAFGIAVDDFKFGPSPILNAPADVVFEDITTEANSSYLPLNVGAGLGTYDYYAIARQGENLKISFRYQHTATPGSGTGTFAFPVPRSLVVNLLHATVRVPGVYQTFSIDHNISQVSGADQFMVASSLLGNTAFYMTRMGTGSVVQGQHILASATVDCEITLPISTWNSTNALSNNEFSIKIIKTRGEGNGGTSITALITNIDFTETEDSHNSWNGSQFTAPKTGRYSVLGNIRFNASVSGYVYNYINGVAKNMVGVVASDSYIPIAWEGELQKGEVLSFRAGITGTLQNSPYHWISIKSVEDLTVLGAVRNTEYLAVESSVKTPTATNTWMQMTGNSVVLTPGSWVVYGIVYFSRTTSPDYTGFLPKWSTMNGDDTTTEPPSLTGDTPLPDSARLTIDVSSVISEGTYVMPIVRKTVTADTEVFLVPRAGITTPANARVYTVVYAERIK